MAGMMPPRGNVSISSHSGALGIALLDYVKSNNFGIAHFASIGNRIDISSNDLLEFWEDDDNTRVILLYLETFGNPRRFSRLARRLTRKKPIIAVKAGRSEVGEGPPAHIPGPSPVPILLWMRFSDRLEL